MNIDEYRAMIAKEKETPTTEQTPPAPEPQAPVTPEVPATPAPETEVPTATSEPTTPQEFEVDGEKLTVEQIKEFKAGYLRTKDYTQKTQEAARIKREAEEALRLLGHVKSNPQLSEQIGIPLTSDADKTKRELEDRLVAQEVELLSIKYTDFDAREALELASTRPGLNLEDAYHLIKSKKPAVPPVAAQPAQLDIEELKKQIRTELLKEIETSTSATQTIISSNDSVVPTAPTEPPLTEAEKEYCRKSRTSEEEYIKMKKQMRRK